jgi:hypothetical protein
MTVETGTALHGRTPEEERFGREVALDETIEQSFPRAIGCPPFRIVTATPRRSPKNA